MVFIVCCFPRDWLQVMDKIYFSNYISRGWDTYIGFPSCHAYMDQEISKKANYPDVSVPTNFVKYLYRKILWETELPKKLFALRFVYMYYFILQECIIICIILLYKSNYFLRRTQCSKVNCTCLIEL